MNLNNFIDLENKLLTRMKVYNVSAVDISIIGQGNLILNKLYKSNQLEEPNSNNLFQAGSISKLVTAIGILKLVEDHDLSLDSNINNYLTSWKINCDYEEKVTIRRLVSHSAGINIHGFKGYKRGEILPSTIQILQGIAPANTEEIKLINKPGEKFIYSGGGFTILQLLIEDIAGEKFDIWMQDHILPKLNMNLSSFKQSTESEIIGHNDAEGNNVEGGYYNHPELAAAGLWTRAEDLSNFLMIIFQILDGNNSFISREIIQQLIIPQIQVLKEEIKDYPVNFNAMGFGTFLNIENDKTIFFHDGMNEGFISRIIADPVEKNALIIMMNNDMAFDLIDEITIDVANMIQAQQFKIMK